MADQILRSKHAFGTSAGISSAIENELINEYDILFLTDPDGNRLAWIDKNGKVQKLDVGMSEDAVNAAVSNAVSTAKGYADEKFNSVDSKINSVESAIESMESSLEAYAEEKYEITDAPEGTLVNYYDKEIRIMCPVNTAWEKQSVGQGGDANTYYVTFKTYFTNDEVVGYIEHLGDQKDAEILTDIKIDKNGRRYQPTWLGVAKYNEESGKWTYYGANSTEGHYIGWDYQLDQYNADGVMIASERIRINLANEDCYSVIKPYYVSDMTTSAVTEANVYTDEKIEVVEEKINLILEGTAIVEFD